MNFYELRKKWHVVKLRVYLVHFLPFIARETLLVTSFLLSWTAKPLGGKFFPLRIDPLSKGRQINFDSCLPQKCCHSLWCKYARWKDTLKGDYSDKKVSASIVMSQHTTKPPIRLVRLAKTKISLRMRAVCSKSSLIASPGYTERIKQEPGHTGWMYRLIKNLGHTGLIVVRWLKRVKWMNTSKEITLTRTYLPPLSKGTTSTFTWARAQQNLQ